jgi:hypothetical protein
MSQKINYHIIIYKDNQTKSLYKAPYWVYKKSNHYGGWISWSDFLGKS